MTVANIEPDDANDTVSEAHAEAEGSGSALRVTDSHPNSSTPSKPDRACYFILGMHRSGTSSVAGTLVKLGVVAPAHLLGANEGNETGHWESQPLIDFHDQLLASAGSRWDDWRMLKPDWYDTPVAAQFKERANQLLDEEFGEAPLFVFKDPRNCRFARFWLEIFAERGIAPKIVLPIRSPLEVAHSHYARDGFPLRKGLLLWLRHTLDAEAASRDLPRAVIEWDTFLSDWPSAIATMESALGSFPARTDFAAPEINRFLRYDLKHQRVPKEEIECSVLVHHWVEQTYVAMLELSVDGGSSSTWAKLDKIRAQFDEASLLFGAVLADTETLQMEMEHRVGQLLQDQKDALAETAAIREKYKAQLVEIGRLAEALDGAIRSSDEMAREHEANVNSLRLSNQRLIEHFQRSRSWRITAPFRFGTTVFRTTKALCRRAVVRGTKRLWQNLPLKTQYRQRLKNVIFSTFPMLFRDTASYTMWVQSRHSVPIDMDALITPSYEVEKMPVLISSAPAPVERVKFVAFYLPQFHPIPENDEWWGKGFTEWTNVRTALPQFDGHQQPNVPGELGYYDLRDTWVFRRQVELAKLYGVHAFCFYFYWFGGKRLLEKPLEMWLSDPSLDLNFCVCWANENWSRRWDGLDSEILIAQDHSAEDDLAFIAEVAPILRDRRNLRIDGKPLLIVYRPSLLPSARETASRWRQWCRDNGIGEIYLAYTQSFDSDDPQNYGFDAAIEFPPNVARGKPAPPDASDSVVPTNPQSDLKVWDWRHYVNMSRHYDTPSYILFRSVTPAWDNTPRRNSSASIFLNSSPKLFETWLLNAARDTISRFSRRENRLVFINAWNEWAEGAYLEPDESTGYARLQSVRNVHAKLSEEDSRVLLLTHDTRPHGAQYLARELGRAIVDVGKDVEFVCLTGSDRIGLHSDDLLPSFRQVGKVFLAADHSVSQRTMYYQQHYDNGVRDVILNTTVSGSELEVLKQIGFRTICLVHEMPTVIRSMGLEANVSMIARLADKIVFPAETVLVGFETFADLPARKAVIRHQGLLRRNPYRTRKHDARERVVARLHLPQDCSIVLGMAYFNDRKGLDLLVEAAPLIVASVPSTVFVIVGAVAPDDYKRRIIGHIHAQGLEAHFCFLDHQEEPFELFAAADVFALPSREDPFPNVVLESAEVGVPVVAFREATGAASFIEAHGGALASSFNTREYAEKIVALLTNKMALPPTNLVSLKQYALDLMHQLNKAPRISVIVPNYNYGRLMRERLLSIRNQTYPVYELIILDDASTDNSREVIQTLVQELQLEAVTVWNDTNSGSVFRQWSKGVGLCRGDYVWIAEADDSSDPDFLRTLVISMAEDQDVTLAYAQSRAVDDRGEGVMDDYLPYTDDISDWWHSDHLIEGREFIRDAMSIKNAIPNVSATLMRRDALQEVLTELGEGLFRFRVGGDWLVYLHMLMLGKLSYVRRVLNVHRRHSASVTIGLDAAEHVDEIDRLQTIAADLVKPRTETRALAAAYRQQLRKHFGLAAEQPNRRRGDA